VNKPVVVVPLGDRAYSSNSWGKTGRNMQGSLPPSPLKFGDKESLSIRNKGRRDAVKDSRSISHGIPAANRTTSRWRLKSREIIQKTFTLFPDADRQTMKWHLNHAYPFGMRKYTPYKLWLQECKAALDDRERLLKASFTPEESIPTTSDFPLETDEVFRLAESFDPLPEVTE